MAVGGVICCGRWAAGLAGCGVGRCWRWAAGCCEVWQGVQAVQLVGCGVIGAALALLLVSVCFWLAVQVGGVICCGGGVPAGSSTGPGRHRSAPIRQAIRCSGQAAGPAAGRWAKEKGQGRRRGVRCCSGLWSALAVRSAAPGASRCISWAAGVCSPFRCRAAGAGTDPGATVPAGNVPAWHGLRWRCSIRCVFVPPPEGSDSPLYRVVP